MEFRVANRYMLEFTTEELRLVSRALRCALRDEDLQPALRLQEGMLETRAHLARQAADDAEMHANNAQAARTKQKGI